MSSIRKRKGKYQVQVRVQGQNISKTFNQLKHARKWGVYYENKILLGNQLETLNKHLTLKNLITKCFKEVSSLKKGYEGKKQRLYRLLKESIVDNKVYRLTTKDLIEFK